MSTETELRAAVQSRVGADEEVLGAFVGIDGARPGVEAFGIVPFMAARLLTGSYPVAVLSGIAAFLAVTLTRRYFTVARTNRSVLLIDNGRRSMPSANANLSRLAVTSIAMPSESGDPRVTVGHNLSLWLKGSHQDEARRLARLPLRRD